MFFCVDCAINPLEIIITRVWLVVLFGKLITIMVILNGQSSEN